MKGHRKRVEMLRAWARHDAETFSRFGSTVERLGVGLENARILDVGCGSNAPMSVMLHSRGARVTGVDAYVGYRWGLGIKPSRYLSYLREAGVAKTVRKVLGEVVYDRVYFSGLSQSVGFRLDEYSLDLRTMNVAERLDFEDGSFDIVHSNATWEHVEDVGRANAEIARVLRPGGIAYIEIHLFPSVSGGHDLPWIVPGQTDLGNVMAWQHLRDPQWRPPVFLNRLRERDYRNLFEATPGLDIVDWITEYTEGTELLTADIRRELQNYTPDELTKRSIIAVVRRG